MADRFVLIADGFWRNEAAFLFRPNSVYSIGVKKIRSRFDKDRPPIFGVVLGISTAKNHFTDFVIKSFNNESDARAFAGKLANLLNEE